MHGREDKIAPTSLSLSISYNSFKSDMALEICSKREKREVAVPNREISGPAPKKLEFKASK